MCMFKFIILNINTTMHCKPLPGMLIFKSFTEDNYYTTCLIKNLNKYHLQPLHRAYAKLYYMFNSTYKKTQTKKQKIEKNPVSCHCHTFTHLILFGTIFIVILFKKLR